MTEMSQLWADQQAATQEVAEFTPGNLATKFLEPPFSVLDTRGGRWQQRRQSWLSLGIKSELGRGLEAGGSVAEPGGQGSDLAGPMRARMTSGDGRELQPGKGNARSDYGAYQSGDARAFSNDLMKGNEGPAAGISIFDPVLCELAYRWWAPEGGTILDPFAGGSVRGIVAAKLGHPYTGVDLSGPQLAANREQAGLLLSPSEPMPTWLHGDSRQVLAGMPEDQLFDMVFSCPPYYDLEVYSDHPADLSNMGWPEFLVSYEAIIEQAARHLRPDRFAVFVVSEIRDPEGMYRGLVPRTIHAFALAGMRLYNDAVLVNSAGSLPLRVTKQMEASRKLGRTHQNILCFLKGKPPRGWSYDRAAPPSPQQALGLVGDDPPAAPAPGPAAAPVLAVAPVGAVADDDRQRPPEGRAVRYTLTAAEMQEARQRAERIVADDTRAGWKMKFDPGSGEDRLAVNVRGFAAEIAAARVTGLHWNDEFLADGYAGTDKRPDLGRRTEVRNALRANGRLFSYQNDRDEWDYLLVTGAGPEFVVAGWMPGAELRRADHWREPPEVRLAAYAVEQRQLRPLPTGEQAELAAEPPALPCSRLFCTLAAGHAMGHQLELPPPPRMRLDDGRLADPATGELLLADGTPAPHLEPPPAAAGRSADYALPPPPLWGAQDLSAPPMPLSEWLVARDELYQADDPARPCWGCGRQPVGRDRDGGPLYERHTHHQEGTP